MSIYLAKTASDIFGEVTPPAPVAGLGSGGAGISTLLTNILSLVFVGGGIVFLFIIIQASYQLILSGGDKEALSKTRAKLVWAALGLLLLSLSLVIAKIVGGIVGIDILKNIGK